MSGWTVFSVVRDFMPKNLRPIMQFILSVSLLGVASYLVLNPSAPAEAQKWATGIIGTLLGFWLRGR
jgi:hypothetical protein